MKEEETIIIIGVGLIGPILALALKKLGLHCILFDRRQEPSSISLLDPVQSEGASINLAPNGLKIIDELCHSLYQEIERVGCPIQVFTNCNSDGDKLGEFETSTVFKPRYGYVNIGIARSALQSILINRLKSENILVHFNKSLVAISQAENELVTLTFKDGSSCKGGMVIGADGLHSMTRSLLFGAEKPTYTKTTQTIGVSPRPIGHRDVFHTVFGLNASFLTYPLSKTHLAWAMTLPEENETPETWKTLQPQDMESIKQESQVMSFKSSELSIEQLVTTSDKIFKIGLYDRPALSTWNVGRVTLIGDAAHPSTPHIGQGANQGVEDIGHLYNQIKLQLNQSDKPPSLIDINIATLFSDYQESRIIKTTELVEKARKMGALRVSPKDKCKERDQLLRNAWQNNETLYKAYDMLFSYKKE
ncbi:hypothetical protein DFA_10365 [Cavenderia fasciculata]|uniref:FAD-binding domain-containing protein n=1 Tax=Cavenderia fasciculata TaxID=261658 RepID=F4QA04_CACFS|nr:uncharacterized protein DFA_10365 [Cavenderia fasciculata]EGG15523.1 hypothetical protein DFA_10365 [Cavenderia fasciculata]|eukprot:XP_004354265.1 hypothetical protein DFA_10365 [Cavenderia fasciculata]